jgi:predicted transcriptional regulator
MEMPMPVELLSRTDKQIAFNALQRMPESATLEEISEELAILAAIRRGEVAAEAGRTLTHDEVKQRFAIGC